MIVKVRRSGANLSSNEWLKLRSLLHRASIEHPEIRSFEVCKICAEYFELIARVATKQKDLNKALEIKE